MKVALHWFSTNHSIEKILGLQSAELGHPIFVDNSGNKNYSLNDALDTLNHEGLLQLQELWRTTHHHVSDRIELVYAARIVSDNKPIWIVVSFSELKGFDPLAKPEPNRYPVGSIVRFRNVAYTVIASEENIRHLARGTRVEDYLVTSVAALDKENQ